MNYITYGKWHIYENINHKFPFTFFHQDFADNHIQGFAKTLEEAKDKIFQLEMKR